MPRTCTICTHPEVHAIDGALVAGQSFRNIAEQYGTSATALFRHKSDHLPAVIVKGQAVREEAHALDVVKQLRDINAATLAILEDARDTHQSALALKAVDRVQKQIERSWGSCRTGRRSTSWWRRSGCLYGRPSCWRWHPTPRLVKLWWRP